MEEVYSQRHAQLPDVFSYEFSERVRYRILAMFQYLLAAYPHPAAQNHGFCAFLDWLIPHFNRIYGGLGAPSPGQYAGHEQHHPAVETVTNTQRFTDAQMVDLLELFFRCPYENSGHTGVSEINQILRQEGIGYELTGMVFSPEKTLTQYGKTYHKIITLPEAIKKSSQLLHEQAVRPCLRLLADPRFEQADTEFMKAYEDYRHGRFDHAMTAAGAAFESVLKTICVQKNFTGFAPTMNCGQLLTLCQTNGMFDHDFKEKVLLNTARLRNEMSSAHGRAESKHTPADENYTSYMLHVTASQILLAVALAGL